MAIEIEDGQLRGFMEWLTGEKFPGLDETKLSHLSDSHVAVAQGLGEVMPVLAAAVQEISSGMEGKTKQAYLDAMNEYVSNDGYLPAAAKYVRRVGDDLKDAAGMVEYVKLMIIATLVELLAEFSFALMVAWFFPSILSQLAARLLVGRLVILQWVANIMVSVTSAMTVGIGMQVLMDAIVQLIQLKEGTMAWNSRLSLDAVKVGAWSSAFGLGLGAVGGTLLRGLGRPAGRHIPGSHLLGEIMHEAGTEVGADVTYSATQGQTISPGSIPTNAFSGAISGLAEGFGGKAGRHLNTKYGGLTYGDRPPPHEEKSPDKVPPAPLPVDPVPPPYEPPPAYRPPSPDPTVGGSGRWAGTVLTGPATVVPPGRQSASDAPTPVLSMPVLSMPVLSTPVLSTPVLSTPAGPLPVDVVRGGSVPVEPAAGRLDRSGPQSTVPSLPGNLGSGGPGPVGSHPVDPAGPAPAGTGPGSTGPARIDSVLGRATTANPSGVESVPTSPTPPDPFGTRPSLIDASRIDAVHVEPVHVEPVHVEPLTGSGRLPGVGETTAGNLDVGEPARGVGVDHRLAPNGGVGDGGSVRAVGSDPAPPASPRPESGPGAKVAEDPTPPTRSAAPVEGGVHRWVEPVADAHPGVRVLGPTPGGHQVTVDETSGPWAFEGPALPVRDGEGVAPQPRGRGPDRVASPGDVGGAPDGPRLSGPDISAWGSGGQVINRGVDSATLTERPFGAWAHAPAQHTAPETPSGTSQFPGVGHRLDEADPVEAGDRLDTTPATAGTSTELGGPARPAGSGRSDQLSPGSETVAGAVHHAVPGGLTVVIDASVSDLQVVDRYLRGLPAEAGRTVSVVLPVPHAAQFDMLRQQLVERPAGHPAGIPGAGSDRIDGDTSSSSGEAGVPPNLAPVGDVAARTVDDCVVLGAALLREIYPGGVRPLRSADESAVGLGGVAGVQARLVPGPGWGRVAWVTDLESAVADAEVGTTALVLASYPGGVLGHVFVLRRVADGLEWVDPRPGLGYHVYPPAVRPAGLTAVIDVRAVLIDPAGRVMDPDSGGWSRVASASMAQALRDAPLTHQFGAHGPEIGVHDVAIGVETGLTIDQPDVVLAWSRDGLVKVVDDSGYVVVGPDSRYHEPDQSADAMASQPIWYTVPEVVAVPWGVAGEPGRPGREQAEARIYETFRRLWGASPVYGPQDAHDTTLGSVFSGSEYVVDPVHADLSVVRMAGVWTDGPFALQQTVGVPFDQLYHFLRYASTVAQDGRGFLEEGLAFGREIGQQYLQHCGWTEPGSAETEALAIWPPLGKLMGFIATTYMLAAAALYTQQASHPRRIKYRLAAALRTSLRAGWSELDPDVQEFLRSSASDLKQLVVNDFLDHYPDFREYLYMARRYPDVDFDVATEDWIYENRIDVHAGQITVQDLLGMELTDAGATGPPLTLTDMLDEALGLGTGEPILSTRWGVGLSDTGGGLERLPDPPGLRLVHLELRYLGPTQVSLAQLGDWFDVIDEQIRQTYRLSSFATEIQESPDGARLVEAVTAAAMTPEGTAQRQDAVSTLQDAIAEHLRRHPQVRAELESWLAPVISLLQLTVAPDTTLTAGGSVDPSDLVGMADRISSLVGTVSRLPRMPHEPEPVTVKQSAAISKLLGAITADLAHPRWEQQLIEVKVLLDAVSGQLWDYTVAAGDRSKGHTLAELRQLIDAVDRILSAARLDIRDWVSFSKLGLLKPRSAALVRVDAAVAALAQQPGETQRLRDVLARIRAWRDSKDGVSARDAAIGQLELYVNLRLNNDGGPVLLVRGGAGPSSETISELSDSTEGTGDPAADSPVVAQAPLSPLRRTASPRRAVMDAAGTGAAGTSGPVQWIRGGGGVWWRMSFIRRRESTADRALAADQPAEPRQRPRLAGPVSRLWHRIKVRGRDGVQGSAEGDPRRRSSPGSRHDSANVRSLEGESSSHRAGRRSRWVMFRAVVTPRPGLDVVSSLSPPRGSSVPRDRRAGGSRHVTFDSEVSPPSRPRRAESVPEPGVSEPGPALPHVVAEFEQEQTAVTSEPDEVGSDRASVWSKDSTVESESIADQSVYSVHSSDSGIAAPYPGPVDPLSSAGDRPTSASSTRTGRGYDDPGTVDKDPADVDPVDSYLDSAFANGSVTDSLKTNSGVPLGVQEALDVVPGEGVLEAATSPTNVPEVTAPVLTRLLVPGDGFCLLYSAIAADPTLVAARRLDLGPGTGYWLEGQNLRRALAGLSDQWPHASGSLPLLGFLTAAATALRDLVYGYLESNSSSLPPDVVTQFRRHLFPRVEADTRSMSRAELLDQVRAAGGTADAGAVHIHWQVLRERYNEVRTAELVAATGDTADAAARVAAAVALTDDGNLADSALTVAQLVTYLRGAFRLAEFLDEELLAYLREIWTGGEGQLRDGQVAQLLDNVHDWQQQWSDPIGEVFPLLLAHALNVRLVVHQQTGRPQEYGPDGAPTLAVFYSGGSHYDAMVPATAPAPTLTLTDAPPFKVPTLGAAKAKAPKEIDKSGDAPPPDSTARDMTEAIRQYGSKLDGTQGLEETAFWSQQLHSPDSEILVLGPDGRPIGLGGERRDVRTGGLTDAPAGGRAAGTHPSPAGEQDQRHTANPPGLQAPADEPTTASSHVRTRAGMVRRAWRDRLRMNDPELVREYGRKASALNLAHPTWAGRLRAAQELANFATTLAGRRPVTVELAGPTTDGTSAERVRFDLATRTIRVVGPIRGGLLDGLVRAELHDELTGQELADALAGDLPGLITAAAAVLGPAPLEAVSAVTRPKAVYSGWSGSRQKQWDDLSTMEMGGIGRDLNSDDEAASPPPSLPRVPTDATRTDLGGGMSGGRGLRGDGVRVMPLSMRSAFPSAPDPNAPVVPEPGWGVWGGVARIDGVWLTARAALVNLLVRQLRGRQDEVDATLDRLLATRSVLDVGRLLTGPGVQVGDSVVRLSLVGMNSARNLPRTEVEQYSTGSSMHSSFDQPYDRTGSGSGSVTASRGLTLPGTWFEQLFPPAHPPRPADPNAPRPSWTQQIGQAVVKGALFFAPSVFVGSSAGVSVNESLQSLVWRQLYHGGELAYFGMRGVWTVTTSGAEATRDAAGDVLLSFPVEDAPPADTPDDVGQLFELPAEASEATAAKFRAALWNVSWFSAAAPPPTGLVGGIAQRFGADTGVSDQVDDLITERRWLAVSAYTLSEEGWPSPVMNPGGRPAEWASFVLKAKMRSVQRVRRGPYYLQLDARHSEYGGADETAGSNAGVSVWARGKIIKGPLVDAPAGAISAGGDTSRSTAGASATGEWLFLAEQQEDVAWYKVGVDLAAEVASSVDGVAGTVTRDGTMYLIVSRHDVMRFEELLAAALAGDNSKGVMAPDPGLVDRHPPVFLSHGAGSAIVDVVAGAQLLVAEVARRVKALGYTGADHGVSGLFQGRNAAALFEHQLLRKLQAKYGATEVLASRAKLRSRKGIDFTDTRPVLGGREVLTVNVWLRHSNEVPRQRRIERERSDLYPVNQGSLGYSESQSPWASLCLRSDLRLSSISDSDWTDNIRVQTNHGGSSSLASGTSHTTWRAHGHIYDGPHRALTYESEFVVTMSVRFEVEATASGRPARIVRGMRPWQSTRNDSFVQPAQIRYHVPEPLTLTTPAPADRVKRIGEASHKMVRSRGPHLALGLRRRRLTGQAPFSAGELGPKVTLTPQDRFVEAIRFELIDDVVGQMLDANGVARDSVGRWQVKLFNRYVAVDLVRNGGHTIYQIRDDGTIYDGEATVLIDLSAYNAWDAGGGDIELQALTGIDAEPALASDTSGSYSHSLTVRPSEAEYAVPGGVAFPSFGPGLRKNIRSRAWGESVSQTSVAGVWLVHRKVPHRLMAADALLTVVVNVRRRGIAPATLNAVGQGITSGLIAMNPAAGPTAPPILPVTTQPHPAGPDQDLRYRQVRIRSGLFFYRPTTPARVPPAPGIPRTLTATQLPAWISVERLLAIAPAAGTPTDGPLGNPVLALAEELLARHAPHALTSSWHLQGNTIQTKVTAPAALESVLSLDSLAASLDTELAAGLIYHGVDSSTGSTNHTILVVNAQRVADSQSPYEFQYSGEEEQAGRYIMRLNRKVNRTVRIYRPLSWRFFWNPWFLSGPLEIDHFGVAGLDSAHPRSQAHGAADIIRDFAFPKVETNHHYRGPIEIVISVHTSRTASKAMTNLTGGLNRWAMWLAGPGTDILDSVEIGGVTLYEDVMIPDQIMPGPGKLPKPTVRLVESGGELTTTELDDAIGGPTLALTPADVRNRDVIMPLVNPAILGEAYGLLMRYLMGVDAPAVPAGGWSPATWGPAVRQWLFGPRAQPPSHAVANLLEWTGTATEALRYFMTPTQISANLGDLLAPDGPTLPEVRHDEGILTDLSGELQAHARFYRPTHRGFMTISIAGENMVGDIHAAGAGKASNPKLIALGLGPVLSRPRDITLPVYGMVDLDKSRTWTNRVTDRFIHGSVRKWHGVHYSRVQISLALQMALDAHHQARWLPAPGESTLPLVGPLWNWLRGGKAGATMLLDDGVEILLHPEAAIRFQLVSEHGQPLPGDGLYLPQLTTITETDVERYRDAFSYPTVDGWRMLVTPAHDNGGTFPYTPPADHAADPTAAPTVAPTVAHRTVAELVTWYQTASTYHKTPRQKLVLAIPGGGRRAAAAFAISLGVPVIATTGSYAFTPDGRLLATHNGKPHYWTLYRPDNISHALAEDLVASINLADPRPTPVKVTVPPHAASYPAINHTVNALPSPDGIVLTGSEIPDSTTGRQDWFPLSPSPAPFVPESPMWTAGGTLATHVRPVTRVARRLDPRPGARAR